MKLHVEFFVIFRGDTLRVGVCLPRKAKFTLETFHPYVLDKLKQVKSLRELDKTDPELDGRKYYHDAKTG